MGARMATGLKTAWALVGCASNVRALFHRVADIVYDCMCVYGSFVKRMLLLFADVKR